jgi:drug/metabolite transporter (DMT)-like permease
MTTAEGSVSRPDDGRLDELDELEQRLPGYRYGLVLLLLVATYVLEASAKPSEWTRLVAIILQAVTLLVAMSASRVSVRTIRITTVILAVIVLAAAVSIPLSNEGDNARGAFFIVSALLVGVAPVVIVRGLMQRPLIDVKTILGALCVYVLLGMMFAFAYGAVGAFSSDPFFAQKAHETIADYLYFSYVTQTTVGYGDLTAAEGFGRALAVLEALSGQIYLVTVISLLVGSMRPRHEGFRAARGEDSASTPGDDTE